MSVDQLDAVLEVSVEVWSELLGCLPAVLLLLSAEAGSDLEVEVEVD